MSVYGKMRLSVQRKSDRHAFLLLSAFMRMNLACFGRHDAVIWPFAVVQLSLSLSVCLSTIMFFACFGLCIHICDGILYIDAGPVCPNESKGHVLLGWAKACLVSLVFSLFLFLFVHLVSPFLFDHVITYRPRFAQLARLGHLLSTARDTPFLPCRSHCRLYLGLFARLLLYLAAFGPPNPQQGSQECEFCLKRVLLRLLNLV